MDDFMIPVQLMQNWEMHTMGSHEKNWFHHVIPQEVHRERFWGYLSG